MKRELYLIFLLCISLMPLKAQTFQQNYQMPDHYFHTVFAGQTNDTTHNLFVMGALYDSTLHNSEIQLIELDRLNGNILGQKIYYDSSSSIQNPRVFDFVAYNDNGTGMVAITGSVTVSGRNYAFIAKIDQSGNYTGGAYYDSLVPDAAHSQGLHIIRSQQGFVVAGFTNMDYNMGTHDSTSAFVLRTGDDLTPVWSKELRSGLPNASMDYDMANHVLETDDGYFVTGSITSVPFNTQQAVLCFKLDFSGNQVWSQSYVYGNAMDVGVDAYYDAATDDIYLLTNYSNSHYFGVTVLDDNTGVIDFSRSWRAYDWDNLNRYAFSIFESASDNANLVVSGYIRNGQVLNQDSVLVNGQSIPFVYEFEKMSGDQVGDVFYYDVFYQHPAFNDYFDFWNGQMPLIYYPDMSVRLSDESFYFHVAYRTDSANGLTNIEMIKTDAFHLNPCFRSRINLNHDPITVTSAGTFMNDHSPVAVYFDLVEEDRNYLLNVSCQSGSGCSCETLAADVAAGFNYVINGYVVEFTPVALDAECDSVEWKFGDGTNAYSAGNDMVRHVYPADKIYDACMIVTRTTASGEVCSDSICEKIDMTTTGVHSETEPDIKIWPNPFKNVLYLTVENGPDKINTATITNLHGETVWRGELHGGAVTAIPVKSIPAGLYILKIETANGVIVRKILKE